MTTAKTTILDNLDGSNVDKFKIILKNQKLAHAYCFHGKEGTGKKQLAFTLARFLHCKDKNNSLFKTECRCLPCIQIAKNQYPFVHILESSTTIKLEQVRSLLKSIIYKTDENNRTVIIINKAENLSLSASNSLLKFLEEPKTNIIIIFLTTNLEKILPTIRSRCQLIYFPKKDAKSEKPWNNFEKLLNFLPKDLPNLYSQEEFINLCKNIIITSKELVRDFKKAFCSLLLPWFKLELEEKRELILGYLFYLWFRDCLYEKIGCKDLACFNYFQAEKEALEKNLKEKELEKILAIIFQTINYLEAGQKAINCFEQMFISIKGVLNVKSSRGTL